MFAYEYSFSELVRAMEFALVDCKTRWPREVFFPFDSIVLFSRVECSDIGDRRLCSRAMQVLRKRRLCSFSKRHREWMIHSSVG
jgi:hypothetical protein